MSKNDITDIVHDPSHPDNLHNPHQSEAQEVVNVRKDGGTNTMSVTTAEKIAENFGELNEAQKKARIAQVLSRGFTIDRGLLDVPDSIHYEWVPDDQVELMKSIGFTIDRKYSNQRSLHDAGDGVNRIADTVCMVTSKSNKLLIDAVEAEKYDRMHHGDQRQKDVESSEFTGLAKNAGLPIIDTSDKSAADASSINDAIEESKGS